MIWIWLAEYKGYYVSVHKDKSEQKNAAVLKGIAAFFCSTEFYGFTPDMPYSAKSRHTQLSVYILVCDFLFALDIDKPSVARPHCRSPPSPFVFEPIKKTNGGKVYAKLAKKQELQEEHK